MSTDELRWVRVRTSGVAARSLRDLTIRSAVAAAAGPADKLDLELPDLSEYATPLAKARLLLDTAAEIEHALMVQYLYAGYSLKPSNDSSLTTPQQAAIRSWSRDISSTTKRRWGT
ncbi:MAG: ferritin-like domain-containing protein [Pirellulaceae bacterium]